MRDNTAYSDVARDPHALHSDPPLGLSDLDHLRDGHTEALHEGHTARALANVLETIEVCSAIAAAQRPDAEAYFAQPR